MKRLLLMLTMIACTLGASVMLSCRSQTAGVGEAEGAMRVAFPAMKGLTVLQFDLSSIKEPAVDSMMVYTIVNPVVTADGVQSIGKGFGFVGDAGPSDSSSIGMVDEKDPTNRKALRVFVASGGIDYKLVDRWFPVVESQPTLPSKDQAVRIATNYLETRALLPPDAVCAGAFDSGIQETNTDGVVTDRYVVQLAVKFDRRIQGVPVIGPGQQLTVDVGSEGEVTGVKKFWRDVKPYKKVKVRTATEAAAALQAQQSCCYQASEGTTTVVVTSVDFAYWVFSADTYQEHLSPVYEFRGRCLDEAGADVGPFVGWSEALDFGA